MRKENFRISEDLRVALHAFAEEHGLPLSSAIRLLLARSLGQDVERAYVEEKIVALRGLLNETIERMLARWRDELEETLQSVITRREDAAAARPAPPSEGELAQVRETLRRQPQAVRPAPTPAPVELDIEPDVEEAELEFVEPEPQVPADEEDAELEPEPDEDDEDEAEDEEGSTPPPVPPPPPPATAEPSAPRKIHQGRPPEAKRIERWWKLEDAFWKEYGRNLGASDSETAYDLASIEAEVMAHDRGWTWLDENGVERIDWAPPSPGSEAWGARLVLWRSGRKETLPVKLSGRKVVRR